jgi:putative DNA primase/helicase
VIAAAQKSIPVDLREHPQWVVWRREERDGKTTKVPYCAAEPRRRASATDPATWATFEQAAECPDVAGIGYVFAPDDPFTGVDLDDCFVGDALHPAAEEIVEQLDSYTERSPSGTGVHIIVRAELKGSKNRTSKTPWGAEFETYDRGRYFCITGDIGKRDSVEPRQAELDAVVARMLPVTTEVRRPARQDGLVLDLGDEDLLERARKARNGPAFEALYGGQHDYGSGSEADFALCGHLAFWTGGDPDQIDRLFRGSGLYREKWERDDYRQRTIDNAIAGTTDFYEPRRNGSVESVAAAEGSPPAPAPAPPKFIARRLAEQLASETPVAANASGQLYVFRDGVYRPGGNADLEKRIAQRLGDDWRKQRAAEVIAYLGAVSDRLWLEPPRDRVNCLNGIVGLDGQLQPHTPDFLSPIQINAAFDPAAACPAIDKFLAEVLAPDDVELIYELVGYLVVPDQSLQTAMMFLGEGANGKSTLLNLITDLLGHRNVSSVALHRLDEDRFSVAELEGKLANVFADLDARALNASSMFKSITGGDAVTGERKYANAFTFTPYARLLFSANEPPPTPDSSDAFYRRWQIVPFERRFDPGKADRQLGRHLSTPQELSGLLNQGLCRLKGVRERGAFIASDTGVKAKERFRVDSDSVAGFIEDACERGGEARVPKARLYSAYKGWCLDSSRKPRGKQKFNRQVEATFPEVTVNGVRFWDGIKLEEGL